MPCVQICDSHKGSLSFDMSEILNSLESIGPSLRWYVLTLEAQSRPGANFSMIELEQDIAKNSYGKLMTWLQLIELGSQLFQTTNCVIVGISSEKKAPSLPLEKQFVEDRIIIAAFDNSYWTVCVPTLELVHRIQEIFHDTHFVERVDVD